MTTAMTEVDWKKQYQPVVNPNNSEQRIEFDTIGQDAKWISEQAKNGKGAHIWTLVSGDWDSLHITSGLHMVNRMAYYYTDVPFTGDYLEIKVSDISDQISIDEAFKAYKQLREHDSDFEVIDEFPDDAYEHELVIELADELDVDSSTLLMALDFYQSKFDAYERQLAAENLSGDFEEDVSKSTVKKMKI